MNASERAHALNTVAILEAELARRDGYKINRYFQDDGPLRRELYAKALQFFKAGARFPERMLLGGNRVGKTDDAAYEVSIHMTGLYPAWWEGRRFAHPVDVWTAGDTATTTRDIQQLTLYGPVPQAPRTGMIPGHLIRHASPKNSIPGGVETIFVKHASGGESSIQFKSYDQRREAFQGTSKHIIWLDEECPDDIYVECLLRTLTCGGIVMTTFTPVEGLTPFVQTYIDSAVMLDDEGELLDANSGVFSTDAIPDDPANADPANPGTSHAPLAERQKVLIMIGWDEVPHLSAAAQAQILASIPPYQRAARTRGIPNLGSGVIYPIPEEEIKIAPFEIPPHWARGYGMDVGWNWTSAVHGAYDKETSTWYLYREHHRSHAEPPVHAAGIKAPGAWIPGLIDPAANGRSQPDGRQLLQLYRDLGMEIDIADNGVEAGINTMWTLLTAGRIKVFASLKNWFTEYRMYRRDAKGRVIKKNDHLMDASRYLTSRGWEWLRTGPAYTKVDRQPDNAGSHGWMG